MGQFNLPVYLKRHTMKNYILFPLFYLSINLFSQNITEYKISFCGKPQTLQLNQNNNGKITGYLETKLWIKKTLKSRRSKDLTFKKELSKTQAEKLFYKLKNGGIDSLSGCENGNKNEKTAFLDADYLVIDIKNDKTDHKEFPEVYPLSQNGGKVEENCVRNKAQKIVNLIDEEIHLKNQFAELIKGQKIGVYCYGSGNSILCIKKKKQ